MCLADAVVTSWSVQQGVAGLSPSNDEYFFLSLNSANSVKAFRANTNISLFKYCKILLLSVTIYFHQIPSLSFVDAYKNCINVEYELSIWEGLGVYPSML